MVSEIYCNLWCNVPRDLINSDPNSRSFHYYRPTRRHACEYGAVKYVVISLYEDIFKTDFAQTQ